MKSRLNFLLSALALLLATSTATQAQGPAPRDGYWVLEYQLKTPDKTTVYFYNDQHQLLYKETISRSLDISKGKVRRQLNAVLRQSLIASTGAQGPWLARRLQ